ncbi:helix-turn-helix domain-containing protein [Neoaquamicrobium sediminum]|uniref:hypothetical protein n=1 Tax=Neoaquamicrobium sediminum TaxID=1849104 RepID=UPI001564A19A|nr:hypothetical protein [Mesorhizobium sediminum]NRC55067.1 hypothetical protein [Mesorhizobium sediminum]
MTVPHREWLNDHRRASEARGGRPFTASEVIGESYRYNRDRKHNTSHIDGFRNRTKGEVVNPLTGEVARNCLTIARTAKWLSLHRDTEITTRKLTVVLEEIGWINQVLTPQQVPMVQAPELRKVDYRHRPEATQVAVRDNILIPLTIKRDGKNIDMILVTPEGQLRLSREITERLKERKRTRKARAIIKHLVDQGRRQAEIVELTGYSKQAVSYHMKQLAVAA